MCKFCAVLYTVLEHPWIGYMCRVFKLALSRYQETTTYDDSKDLSLEIAMKAKLHDPLIRRETA